MQTKEEIYMQLLKFVAAFAFAFSLNLSAGDFLSGTAHAAKKNANAKCESSRYEFDTVFKRCVRTDDPGF